MRYLISERCNKRWNESEDAFIKSNYKKMSVSGMAQKLGRSLRSTRTRVERLGLSLMKLERNKAKPNVKRKKYKGWHYDSYGRKIISVAGRGRISEHRYFIERKIGRRLESHEHVHHINCNKRDNRIENLHLFQNISRHLLCHRSIESLVPYLMENGVIKFNSNSERYEIKKKND